MMKLLSVFESKLGVIVGIIVGTGTVITFWGQVGLPIIATRSYADRSVVRHLEKAGIDTSQYPNIKIYVDQSVSDQLSLLREALQENSSRNAAIEAKVDVLLGLTRDSVRGNSDRRRSRFLDE